MTHFLARSSVSDTHPTVSGLYITSSLRYAIKKCYEEDATKTYYMQPDTPAGGCVNDADETLVEIPPETKFSDTK